MSGAPQPVGATGWIALGLVALALVVHLDVRRFADPDFFVNLYTGREIVTRGEVPVVDTVTFTVAGQPWNDYEWLSRLLFFRLQQWLGGPGLVLMRLGIAAALALVYLLHAVRRGPGFAEFVATLTMLALCLQRYFLFRATLFTFLFVALLLLLFDRTRAGRPAWLWLLPPLMALWVNLHAGFALGVSLLLMLAVESVACAAARRLPAPSGGPLGWLRSVRSVSPLHAVGALVASIAATGLHPLGYRNWLVIFGTLGGGITPHISEWQPLLRYGATLWPVYLLMLVTIGALVLGRRAVTPLDLMAVLSLAVASFVRVRFVPLFAIVAAFVLLHALPAARTSLARKPTERAAAAGSRARQLSAIVAALLLGVVTIAEGRRDLQIRIAEHFAPVRGVSFLRQNDIHGNILNELDWGGYIRFALPESRIFVDSRSDTAYPEHLIGEWYRFVNAVGDWQSIAEKHGAEIVFIRRVNTVVERLEQDPRWVNAYADEICAIFVLDSPTTAPLVERLRDGRVEPPRVTSQDYFVRQPRAPYATPG